MKRAAFTLIELIIVIAMLAILAALIFAAVQRARFTAGRTDCQNRLRNQITAVLHYESREGRLPPGSVSGPFAPRNVPENVNHGLWPALLGDIGERADLYEWTVNYDHEQNRDLSAKTFELLLCPSLIPDRRSAWNSGVTDFAAVSVNAFLADIGEIDPCENFESAMPVNGGVAMTEISDGLGNTFLVVETAGRSGIGWSEPNTVSVKSILGGRAHLGGANAGFCDGSVRFLSAKADVKLLAKLATRSGQETIDD